ncbi:MAG: T9SS type A sorting domain-containing protein [Bacteroidia bacterium]|nr:T9SS type A sorting domain-containing protein [Bacteroidia bacterium]
MKRVFILCALFTSLASCFSQNTWAPLNSGTNRNLKDLCFPGDLIGYVVGEKGAILKTSNAGQTWISQFSDSTVDFISVHFPSPNIGYAISGNKVYGTKNGGNLWHLIYTDSLPYFNTVRFVNDSVGFIGTVFYILKTSDYGQHWSIVETPGNSINSISFPSPSVGYFAGGPDFQGKIYKTTNLGQSFTSYTLGMQSIKERIYFINDSVGYITGWYGSAMAKTTDGGEHWTTINPANDPQGWDVYFSDESNGLYVNNTGGLSRIFSSADGGMNWTLDISLPNYSVRKFVFTSLQKGFAVGNNGSIYSTQLLSGLTEEDLSLTTIVYPNPTNNNIVISCAKPAKFILFNELGQIAKQFKSENTGPVEMSLNDLTPGVYFLKNESDRKHTTHKIVVSK